LADDAVELTAFGLLQRAGDWNEFREAVRLFPGPAQNFVYADVDGHIGWYAAGRLPIRRGGIGPWRAAALFEDLEAREGWTTDDFARLQGELLSLPHLDLSRALLEAAARHRGDAAWDGVTREMGGWDGRLEPDSRAAALAVYTFRAIGTRVILPRLAGLPMG